MPVEIRELVIRATVDPGDAAGGCAPAPARGGPEQADASGARSPDDLLQACIREVLRILEEKKER
jgi:hypothetical protein